MNPGERVLAILDREPADRLAVDLWHTPEVGEALRRALELAVSQQQVQAKLEQNKQRLENLPLRVEERRAKLTEPLPPLDLPPRGAGAAELESRLLELEKTFAEKQQAQTALKAEPKDRSLRLTQIPEEEA